MSEINIAIARTAWSHLAHGHRTGEFSPYLAMLSEHYEFSIPVGPFRGSNQGKERAKAFFAAVATARPNLTYREPLRICASADTVVIEFEDDGDFGGYPYRNRIAASFDIKDGLITAYGVFRGCRS
jgi:ketosteroid isomerase-like protein